MAVSGGEWWLWWHVETVCAATNLLKQPKLFLFFATQPSLQALLHGRVLLPACGLVDGLLLHA